MSSLTDEESPESSAGFGRSVLLETKSRKLHGISLDELVLGLPRLLYQNDNAPHQVTPGGEENRNWKSLRICQLLRLEKGSGDGVGTKMSYPVKSQVTMEHQGKNKRELIHNLSIYQAIYHRHHDVSHCHQSGDAALPPSLF